ncbi:hypothetical protein HMPREF1292_00195 [Corynebacterium sp. KPL1995]|nr:hypothetical protein HMPREF1292_00195 [Corynebacterium sp. KPL1995]ERS75136.1 hypothetical protein HMPREF1290_00196 [Corynebacterium sp. KPL1989]RUP92947.1 hypothetical protein D8M19_06785 [Corynebacterium pseudodiphtheriticum]RUP99139.1 hypothetical protein D8M17_08080 [Corynebacterium pseudodiphtheriticum]
MLQLKKQLCAAVIFLSGLSAAIFGVLALTGKIGGVWPVGISLLVFFCAEWVYSQIANAQKS